MAGSGFESGWAEDSKQPSPRLIPLEGQSNFRDIGGYEAADGRTVKWGEVYRSGRFAGMTDADIARLEELGLSSVASFLTEEELENAPSRLPPSAEHIRLPMEAGNMGDIAAVADEARLTGDFSKLSPDINPEIHRMLIVEGKEYYAALLRDIIDSDKRPLVYHCSHGVHRTGTATAILLSALGVPWETVREDYLLSNVARGDEIERRLGELRAQAAKREGKSEEEVDTTNMEAFYILEGSYIDASLEQAMADYGSMEAFIRDGLGISDEEIAALKQELLED
ncbi:MAG: tyrosine-protein phosphatase [Verrucomicrobiota bacterium]